MTVFPFRWAGMTAEIGWLTGLDKSYTTERRAQLRAVPRLVQKLDFEFTGQQTRQAQALAELGDGELAIPDWRFEQVIAAGFAAASLSVTIDAAYFTPAVGDAVIVWQDAENFTETTVASIVSNTLTLADGPTVAYGVASVLPALSGVVTGNLAIAGGRGSLMAASMGLTVTDYGDFSAWFAGDTFDGKYVAPRDALGSAQTGSVVIAKSNIDMGLGPIQPVRVRAINDWFYSLQMMPKTKLELLEAEAVFHKLSGRLNSFWRPTWLPDFRMVWPVNIGQFYIRVAIVAAGTDIPAIAIEWKDGTKDYFEVVSWSTSATYTTIIIDGTFSTARSASDALTVSIMRLSRLDTDVVSFKFDSAGDANVMATTVGVVE